MVSLAACCLWGYGLVVCVSGWVCMCCVTDGSVVRCLLSEDIRFRVGLGMLGIYVGVRYGELLGCVPGGGVCVRLAGGVEAF